MSAVKRALGIVGGAAAAGGAAFYIIHAQEVSNLQKQKDDVEQEVVSQQNRVRRNESLILEQDSLIKALQQQSSLEKESLKEIDSQVEAAKLKLQQVEAQRKQKYTDIKRMETDQVRHSATGSPVPKEGRCSSPCTALDCMLPHIQHWYLGASCYACCSLLGQVAAKPANLLFLLVGHRR